jgi:hypothetical protein
MSFGASPAESVLRPRVLRTNESMRRTTSLVVACAFVLWVMLIVAASFWASGVLRDSSAAVPTVLEGASGVVLYREAGDSKEASAEPGMQVFDGDEIVTRFGSRATLRAFDGSVLDVLPDTRVSVMAARIGRFNPSATRAWFDVEGGAIRLSIPQILDKRHTLNLVTPHGAAAFVPGEYTVRVAPDATRISVWDGRIAAAIGDEFIEVGPGRKIVIGPDPLTYRVVDVLENVLLNGDFAARFLGWQPWDDREQGRPDVPGHVDIVEPVEANAPARALRISRESAIDAHNETGLRQSVGADVRGAKEIVVEARVKLDLASLSGGGYLGSEYPLMMRVRLRDARGGEQVWTQGLFYANPENRPTPIGDMVERGVWTTVRYDLTARLNQPSSIEVIEISGSGHTFDASIGDLKLLVD